MIHVDGIAHDAPDEADSERQGRNGGDQIIRADDGRDDGGGHNDAADAEAPEYEEAPELVEVVDVGDSEGAAACGGQALGRKGGMWENSPAVMQTAETIMRTLTRPRKTVRSQSTMQAPAKMEKKTGRLRMPTPTGS